MGKGDKKTRRGKLFSGSYGVLRPRRRSRSFSVVGSTKKTVARQAQTKAAMPKDPPKPKPEAIQEKPGVVVEETAPVAEEAKTAPEETAPTKKPAAKKPATKSTQAKKPAAKKPAPKKDKSESKEE